jgi:hypothetical protein
VSVCHNDRQAVQLDRPQQACQDNARNVKAIQYRRTDFSIAAIVVPAGQQDLHCSCLTEYGTACCCDQRAYSVTKHSDGLVA